VKVHRHRQVSLAKHVAASATEAMPGPRRSLRNLLKWHGTPTGLCATGSAPQHASHHTHHIMSFAAAQRLSDGIQERGRPPLALLPRNSGLWGKDVQGAGRLAGQGPNLLRLPEASLSLKWRSRQNRSRGKASSEPPLQCAQLPPCAGCGIAASGLRRAAPLDSSFIKDQPPATLPACMRLSALVCTPCTCTRRLMCGVPHSCPCRQRF
jgi:hypothetical protein